MQQFAPAVRHPGSGCGRNPLPHLFGRSINQSYFIRHNNNKKHNTFMYKYGCQIWQFYSNR